jgi:hypothetical protein
VSCTWVVLGPQSCTEKICDRMAVASSWFPWGLMLRVCTVFRSSWSGSWNPDFGIRNTFLLLYLLLVSFSNRCTMPGPQANANPAAYSSPLRTSLYSHQHPTA